MDEDIVLRRRLKISPVAAVDSVKTRQLKQNPVRSKCTQSEQLYKSFATNSATSKPNWFQIAFTKGSFQVHRQIGLVHTHPLLGSCRRSCSGANVALTGRVTLDKSIRWNQMTFLNLKCGSSLVHFLSWISQGKCRKVGRIEITACFLWSLHFCPESLMTTQIPEETFTHELRESSGPSAQQQAYRQFSGGLTVI